VKRTHHGERKRALARKDLGGAVFPADDRGDVRLTQPLLLHAEEDCIDRIGLAELEALFLVVVDQLCEELEPCAVAALRLRVDVYELELLAVS